MANDNTYTTISGDMWDLIANQQLGSELYMVQLMELNMAYRNIVVFPAGVTLLLPPPIEDKPAGLPPWKEMLYGR